MIYFILSYIWYKTKNIELETIKDREKTQKYSIISDTCEKCGQQYYWCICG